MSVFSRNIDKIVRKMNKMMTELEREEAMLDGLNAQYTRESEKFRSRADAAHSEAVRASKIRRNIGKLIEAPAEDA